MDKTAPTRMPPTTLAFIGDAVYTLYVRRRIAQAKDCVAGTLHVTATKFVNAKAQAQVFDSLIASGALNAEEAEVARRAKNAHLHSRAKSATSDDYHKATALEAVLGYAELAEGAARTSELLTLCADCGGLDKFLGE